ncbi:hypothetical protein BGZ68_000096 [Mortierella alpina]|nr:hypothetical protein BGZ68_000096 [Mortierella alpina]
MSPPQNASSGAMEETQLFRLMGTADILEITLYQLHGQSVVYWEDIEEVFPGVRQIMNGRVVINKLRDSNGIRITPSCIRHVPGITLDVILSSDDRLPVSCPAIAPNLASVNSSVDILDDAPTDTSPSIQSDSQCDIEPDIGRLRTTADALCTSPSPSPPTKRSGIGAPVAFAGSISNPAIALGLPNNSALTEHSQEFQRLIHKLDALHDQGALTQQIAQEVWKLQQQMNDRLILIQSKTEAILTQQLELAEYPVPRLFIVLPEEPVKYDPANWFRTKFRLHFICECGKHTEASNSKIPHHLHLAKHEGYLVREPTAFFRKYGPFLLLMLELIKCGTNVAGHVVPTLASLKVIELVDSVRYSAELIRVKIEYALECIDRQLANIQASLPEDSVNRESRATMTPQDLSNYLKDVEGLEGAELRQLRSFLKTTVEDNLLGNLYRMTTTNGHVKWVCRDHYRASYQEKQVLKLREVVKLARGEIHEQLGKITITLASSIAAAEFYTAISKANGILELDLDLSWGCTGSDLDELEDALKKTRVVIIRLRLRQLRTSKIPLTSSPYGALNRIRTLPQLKIFHIVLPADSVKLPSFPTGRSSQFCKLSVDLVPICLGVKELQALTTALKANSILTTLDLRRNWIEDDGVLMLAEALKVNATLTILNLSNNLIGTNGGQALAEALKINSTLTTLSLGCNSIADGKALAEALKINTTLTTLDLSSNLIGPGGGQALAEALRVNSTLTTLDLSDNSLRSYGGLTLAGALEVNFTLIALDLSRNCIQDNIMLVLADALKINATLSTLTLDNNSIGPNGGQALAEALKTNTTLTALSLRGDQLGSSAGKALAEALKINATLTTLTLDGNWTGGTGGEALAEALKINSALNTLNLHDNALGPSGGQALAEALAINSILTTLDVSSNSIGPNGGQAFAEVLMVNKTLIILDMSDNSVGPHGGQALAEALEINSTLISLTLDGNSIGDKVGLALAKVLKINSTLTTLRISGNAIEGHGGQELAEALKSNSTLTALELADNSIGPDAGQALAEALSINKTLSTLILANTAVGPYAAQALIEVLKINTTLTTLSLAENSIGYREGQALAAALKINSTLTTLILDGNAIGDNAEQTLPEALKVNSTLTTLSLRSNSIGPFGGLALAEALKSNSTLTTLDLEGNSRRGSTDVRRMVKDARSNRNRLEPLKSTRAALQLGYSSVEINEAQVQHQVLQTVRRGRDLRW